MADETHKTFTREQVLKWGVAGSAGLVLGQRLGSGKWGIEEAHAAGSNYIGEIRMFAGSFAPVGWAFCNGQLIPISENTSLFTLIGTTYGGDGQETFALPNLQSRFPLHQGSGFVIGEQGGVESVTVTVSQIPAHTHAALAAGIPAANLTPGGNLTAEATKRFYTTPGTQVPMAPTAISPAGGSQPHENMQPFLVVNFIISLFGVFPSQT